MLSSKRGRRVLPLPACLPRRDGMVCQLLLLSDKKKKMEKPQSSRLFCGLDNVSHAECPGHPRLLHAVIPPLPPALWLLPLYPTNVARQCFCLEFKGGRQKDIQERTEGQIPAGNGKENKLPNSSDQSKRSRRVAEGSSRSVPKPLDQQWDRGVNSTHIFHPQLSTLPLT